MEGLISETSPVKKHKNKQNPQNKSNNNKSVKSIYSSRHLNIEDENWIPSNLHQNPSQVNRRQVKVKKCFQRNKKHYSICGKIAATKNIDSRVYCWQETFKTCDQHQLNIIILL